MTIPFVEEAEASPKEGECESQFFNTVCLAGPSGEVVSQLTETWTGKNGHHVLRFFPACSGARTVRSSTIAKRTCGTLLRLFSKSVSRSGDEWIRNLHFWEDYVDGSWASRGDSPGFVETEFGRVGIGTMALMKRVPQTFCKPKVHRCRIRFPMYRKHARLDIRTWKASHHQTHTDTHCKQALRLFLSLPLPLPSESGLSHCMQYEEPQMLSRPWFHIRYLDAGVSVLRLQQLLCRFRHLF